jgi:hypothetical protein
MGGVLNTGGLFRIKGKVGPTRASGRLSRSGSTAFGTSCSAKGLKWRAFPIG